MFRIVGGVLLLLLALPGARAADDPKDKSDKPEEQYKALLKEFNDALQEFSKAAREAKTQQARQKVFQEKYPRTDKYATKFLELAEKNPKAPFAEDALIWVVTNGSMMATPGGKDEKRARARALTLLRDHAASKKVARVCQVLGSGYDKEGEALLRAILEKNPTKEAQAEACLALSQRFRQKAELAKQLRDNPGLVKRYEGFLEKETAEELTKADLAKLEAEGEKLAEQLADKYVPAMKPERRVNFCQQLAYSTDTGSEKLLRRLLEKDESKDVQGIACLTLGQVLRQRADRTADAKAAAKLRNESEKFLEQAIDKYADVKLSFYGTVGKRAKTELFDLRHLAVGKPAPEVKGVDQDGKHFKLADYKGKVVLLDFWSEY